MQRELKAEGFDIGKSGSTHDGVDGVAGKLTRSAMAQALEPSGNPPQVGPNAQRHFDKAQLTEMRHIAAGTATGAEVRAVQRELKAEGFDIGKSGSTHDGVDGVAGKLTKSAMAQASRKLGPSST